MSTAVGQDNSKAESITTAGQDEVYQEYPLPDGEKPPATNHQQTVVTTCFLEGQWYAGTCGRFFGPVSREATVHDAHEIAKFGQAGKDADGSNAIRVGVISYESLEMRGAKFTVKRLINQKS